ncbi:MAG TPA: hypothetical protein VFA50_17640 [Stellaceae bacterium]|nr:hypothetical protein [Stellaceae bacterium]
MRISKRTFLRSALALLAVPGGTLFGLWATGETSDVAARITDLIGARAGARAIGAAFLARFPTEADQKQLSRRIAQLVRSSGEARLGGEAISSRALQRAVRQAITSDFETGRMIELDGWLLAQTEARICALLVLREHAMRAAPLAA